MDSPLSKLSLDYWYHVLMVVCVVVFLASGSGVLKELPLAPTLAMSAGGFFVGLGEWINHPLQTALMPASAYHPGAVLTGHPRSNKPIGVLFLALGFCLLAFGAYKIFR